jgi:cytidylate kinase
VTLEEFGRIAENDDAIDRMIDERQKERAKAGKNLIFEGRLSGIFLEDADLKIWLKAPLDMRAARVKERDFVNESDLLDLIKAREASEWTRYNNYYGIDLSDLSVYDLVIDTSRWSADQVCEIIIRALEADR